MARLTLSAAPAATAGTDADTDLVRRIRCQEEAAFEALMRRHNSKLFRVARAILKDDAEAEDAVQDGYLEAYRRIGDFRGESQLTTWLTRIVINQALMRLRRQKRDRVVVSFGGERRTDRDRVALDVADEKSESPTSAALRAEVRRILERRIDELPVAFRTVFVMREVEDMTVEETAACLSIPHEVAYHQQVLDAVDKTLIPGAINAELKALLVRVRPAFVAHLEHAKHVQSALAK